MSFGETMIRPRITSAVLLTCLFALLSENVAQAFPGFARKFSPENSLMTFLPCASCHDPFPKLTLFGRRFKENGFRMEYDTANWMESLKFFPVAARTSFFSSSLRREQENSNFAVIKPIAAGSAGSWVSFWVDQPFLIQDGDFRRLDVNDAWIGVYDVMRSFKPGLLNVRGGQFELDLPFTQVRTHNLSSYEPYFLNDANGEFSLSDSHRGVEFSGRPSPTWRYSLALADRARTDSNVEARFDVDVYARLTKDFLAINRVGVLLYDGRERIAGSEARRLRIGADFDLRFRGARASLYGLYLWGRDRDVGVASTNSTAVEGGFIQLEKRPLHWFTLTARYDNLGANDSGRWQTLSLGTHTWFRERFKLTFEYRFRNRDRSDEATVSFDLVI